MIAPICVRNSSIETSSFEAPDFANAGLEVYLQAWAFDGLGGLQTSNALTLWLGF